MLLRYTWVPPLVAEVRSSAGLFPPDVPVLEFATNRNPSIVTLPEDVTTILPTSEASPVPAAADRPAALPAVPAYGPTTSTALLTVTFSV